MDKIPSSLFLPPRAYLVHQEPAQRGYRLATTTLRAPFYPPETEEHHNTPPDIPTGGERSHLFGQAQKNSGDDCCCIMTPAALPIHPPDCEECVQGCEDPSCIVELTPQCTDQCVVVCDDTHHSVGGCIDDTSGGFMCPDATDCSIMDDLVRLSLASARSLFFFFTVFLVLLCRVPPFSRRWKVVSSRSSRT